MYHLNVTGNLCQSNANLGSICQYQRCPSYEYPASNEKRMLQSMLPACHHIGTWNIGPNTTH